MKRKRWDDDEDNAAAPLRRVNHTTTMVPKINDLPDELVVSVLSYFDFYDRSKLRPVCRRLLTVIDAMPPPPGLSLEIRLVGVASDGGQQHPWTFSCNKKALTIRVEVRA